METNRPITILSDLHLGHPATRVRDPEQLAPLFQDAATAVFNGDTAEQLWLHNRSRAQEQLENLARVCIDLGAQPLFLNGNHDPTVSKASHLDLCGGAVLVTHGDILFHEITPWNRRGKALGAAFDRILAEIGTNGLPEFEKRLFAAKRASLTLKTDSSVLPDRKLTWLKKVLKENWPPWRALRILKFWAETPARAMRLGRQFRPEARFIIIGHTHRAGVWQNGRRIVVNTGSFFPLSNRSAIRIEDSTLEVRQVIRRNHRFEFGRILHAFRVK